MTVYFWLSALLLSMLCMYFSFDVRLATEGLFNYFSFFSVKWLRVIMSPQEEVVALLRAWLEKAKEAGGEAASAGDAAVSAHLIDCGRLFTRSWASVEFLHRAAHGTGKVPCSSCATIPFIPSRHLDRLTFRVVLVGAGDPGRTQGPADALVSGPFQGDPRRERHVHGPTTLLAPPSFLGS